MAPERTIILDGFSKTYAMTGWRLGYGIMPKELAEVVTTLQVNSNSCVNAVTQCAGLEAITGPQESVDRMLTEFRARRDLIVGGLNELPGVECATPEGCLLRLPPHHRHRPRLRHPGRPAAERSRRRLPLRDRVRRHGEGHLRFSYANSRENIMQSDRAHGRSSIAGEEPLARSARRSPDIRRHERVEDASNREPWPDASVTSTFRSQAHEDLEVERRAFGK